MMTERQKELWAIIEPYLDGCKLRPDAPPEVIAADKELHAICWDLTLGQ